jgi:uncharacterized protein
MLHAHQPARAEQRTPRFFGSPERQLFGCFHTPAGARADAVAVLCPPFGQEYIRAHRAFVQLAARLCRRGVPVLRFDYYGTGDSAGDSADANVDGWLADIALAAAEARRLANTTHLSLIGLRFGALLAALHAARDGAVDSIVLWDPVVSGTAYVRQLRAMHRQEVRYAYVTPDPAPRGDGGEEILGFPLAPALRHGFLQLDALQITAPPARRILVVESESGTAGRQLHAHFAAMPAETGHRQFDERTVWRREPLRGTVPTRLIDAIADWHVPVSA